MIAPASPDGGEKKPRRTRKEKTEADKATAAALSGKLSPAFGDTAGIRDVRLIERAVRRGWKLPEGLMERLPEAMQKIALAKRGMSPRNKIAATKALIAMHGQNQADDPAPQKMEHTGLIQIEAIRQQLAEDNERLRLIGGGADIAVGNGQSGAICADGEPGQLAVGAAPQNAQRPAPGGSNGNGTAAPH